MSDGCNVNHCGYVGEMGGALIKHELKIKQLEYEKEELIDGIRKVIDYMDNGCAGEIVYQMLVDGIKKYGGNN